MMLVRVGWRACAHGYARELATQLDPTRLARSDHRNVCGVRAACVCLAIACNVLTEQTWVVGWERIGDVRSCRTKNQVEGYTNVHDELGAE
jgi:hypothetical protein